MSTAAERWREDLEARQVPGSVLAAAPESPYGFPTELFRRRAQAALSGIRGEAPTTIRAMEALPDRGSVLDVGTGSGATSLSLANRAGSIVGVDGQDDMLAAFEAAAAAAGVGVRVVQGRWPDVAGDAPVADVVVCGHVLYNVADAPPFVRALDAHAAVRVVLELTARHPIAWMDDLWERFHGIRWPQGPTNEDALELCRDLGYRVACETRVESGDRGGGGFERREDAIALVRRRLCLTVDRDHEIAEVLGTRLREREGLWSAGPDEQSIVTLWWDTRPEG